MYEKINVSEIYLSSLFSSGYWGFMKDDRIIEVGAEEPGFQPLRAVGFIYEPEAVGIIRAYAPEGSRKKKKPVG